MHCSLGVLHLILSVFLLNQPVDDRVHDLLDQVAALCHDIEPKQLKARVLLAQTLEVCRAVSTFAAQCFLLLLVWRSLLFCAVFGLAGSARAIRCLTQLAICAAVAFFTFAGLRLFTLEVLSAVSALVATEGRIVVGAAGGHFFALAPFFAV